MNWRSKWINPVLNKEFRLRMRSPRSAVSVMIYVLALGLLAMGFIYLTMYLDNGPRRFDPSISRVMFYVISFAQLVLIAFMTPALTAGVISGEREKQTLGMLLTTQQSSATIILSKLVSALSFMTVIVLATLPIYSIVFLYGGISPGQLGLMFLFYLFVMLLLGSLGVLFSTLFKRTIVAVIVTYGAGLLIFLVTGLLYLFFMSLVQQSYYQPGAVRPAHSWVGYILGLNPAGALLSILEPGFSREAFLVNRSISTQNDAPISLWLEFVLVYTIVIIVVNLLSIRYIRPVRRRKQHEVETVEAGE
ncbi:ABC transporter permease [Paenibacillus sp. JX-17]|uniref:ABC transporter permease n=1 Tax=Paenibacillus lacisoli TaxID=3064525 RepID=A0ABT9CDF7_9BACL|nr:ABC transporter permease [Paenibacillus sp. JX-17]MDO7907308.1 ABC transporter permease [Paenibacillus sp. JX-17]